MLQQHNVLFIYSRKKVSIQMIIIMHCLCRVDAGEMAMKENAAYGPVTSSQQPQDYIYTEPDGNTESVYDIVK